MTVLLEYIDIILHFVGPRQGMWLTHIGYATNSTTVENKTNHLPAIVTNNYHGCKYEC